MVGILVLIILLIIDIAWYTMLGQQQRARSVVRAPPNQAIGARQRVGGGRGNNLGPSHHQRTYIVDTDKSLINWPHWSKYFTGWKELSASSRPKYADFILCLSGGSRAIYSTRSPMKSRLQSLEITDKVALHLHMQGSQDIAESFEVGPDSTIEDGSVWIVRANWGWKGRASAVVTNTEELQAAYTKYSVLPSNWRKPTKPRVLASKYITDPLLWEGADGNKYKFHVRVNIIVVVTKARRYAVMLPTVEAIPAGKPYVSASWADADIHDTHDDRNKSLYGLLTRQGLQIIGHDKDAPTSPLYDDLVAMVRRVIVPLLPMLSLYDEAEASYDVFGIDAMCRRDGTWKLIEINSTPGLVTRQDDPLKYINDEITQGILAAPFGDIYGGTESLKNGLIYL